MLRFFPLPAAVLLLVLAATPRASSPPPALAAEAPVYMALGDSLAFGVGAANPAAEGYVALAADNLLLNDRFSSRGIELINLSEPGATSAEIVEAGNQLDRALEEIGVRASDTVAGNEAEIISIDVGGNDLLALAEPDSPCFEEPLGGICRTRINNVLSDLQHNLTRTLTALRQAAPQAEIYVFDLFNPYSGTGESLEIIASIGVQQINGVLAAVSATDELGVRFVSVYELFQDRRPQWVASDGIHPNNDGHRVLAEALTAAIEGRNIVLPSDLAVPLESPKAGAVSSSGDDGVAMWLVLMLVPAAFIGGGMVSAAYFLVRGRA